ncbi:Aldo-keto reductase, partial [Tetrabaena socialis]
MRRRRASKWGAGVSGFSDRATWVRSPARTTRVDREQIAESVDASLKRLQVDHVDLLQIHWPDRYVPLFGGGAYDPKLDRPDSV